MNLLSGSITELLTLFLTFIIGLLIYYKYKYKYWKRKNVTQIEPSIPFGNITSLIFLRKSIGEIAHTCYKQFRTKNAKYGGIYHVCKPVLIITDPELIKLILTKDFTYFHDRTFGINEYNDPVSRNLFTERGKYWRLLRTKLSPAFTSGKLKIMFETFRLCSEELLYTIDNETSETNTAIDIKNIMSRFSIDIFTSIAFGLESSSLKDPNSEFLTFGKLLFRSNIQFGIGRAFGLVNENIVRYLRLQQFDHNATIFFANAIRQTIEYRQRNGIIRNDILNMLLRLMNNQSIDDDIDTRNDTSDKNENLKDDAKVFTMSETIAQAISLFFAGHETTSTTITLCLLELARNQEIQERVREDIEQVLEKYSGQLTFDAIADMNYLNKVFNETLRKYPIASILLRKCVKAYKVPNDDLIIDKGTSIFISLMGLHNDPEYYPDPMKFDPERFSDEQISKRHPYTYLPFGEGPRNCIGMRFALIQIKLALTVLLKNYKFTLDPSTQWPVEEDPCMSSLFIPKSRIWFRVEKILQN